MRRGMGRLGGLAFAGFQEVDRPLRWLGPALRRGWLRGGLSCMEARRDWFLLWRLVPGMTGGKGVMAGGQTDWFVLRPSLFIGRLPDAGADAPGPVRWLTDRRAALLPFVFLRMVFRTDAGGWGDDPPPPMRATPGCDYGRSVKNMRPAKEPRLKKPVFCSLLIRFVGTEKHGDGPGISLFGKKSVNDRYFPLGRKRSPLRG